MEAARPATTDDVDRILALSEALRAEVGDQRGGDLWRRTHDPVQHHAPGLRALLGYPDDCVLVGSIDDQVVGYALARAHLLADGTHLAVVSELFVEPAAREVAVGEALLDGVLAWADARGCTGVDATALPGNRAAKNFFETHGFVARSLVMHRSLDGAADAAHAAGDATPVAAPDTGASGEAGRAGA
jgi:ribosomal protein S18 acetylase RimI-like enzyme